MQIEEVIKVVFGIIEYKGKILLGKRMVDKKLCWEFPGGKVEKNERLKEALKRELKEELGIEIKIKKHFKPLKIKNYIFYGFLCNLSDKHTPKNLFHKEIVWIKKEETLSLNLCENDREIFLKISHRL